MDQLLEAPHQALEQVEDIIVKHVSDQLYILASNGKLDRKAHSADHDKAFAAFNHFVQPAWLLQLQWRSVRLWLVRLEPLVSSFETRHSCCIHKGAPLFNVGLSFFMAGDLARASQYIAAAAHEYHLTHGSASPILVGGGMGEGILLKPLYVWLEVTFGQDYTAATKRRLSSSEVQLMIQFLAARQPDAVHCIMSLHRYATQIEGPDNTASRLNRVRALADLLLVFESSLRRWQTTAGELCSRVTALLKPSAVASTQFNSLLSSYSKVDWADPTNLDNMLSAEFARFSTASTPPERAATVAFVAFRLRNSVMHVLDDRLALFASKRDLERAIGFALIGIGLSMAGSEGQIAGL